MADRPLRPATRRCLGEPLPHQQADRPRDPPEAESISSSDHAIQGGYPVLDQVSPAYPGLRGRFLTCYSPVRRSATPGVATGGSPARLACIRHAASVRPEPGSNSPSRSGRPGPEGPLRFDRGEPDGVPATRLAPGRTRWFVVRSWCGIAEIAPELRPEGRGADARTRFDLPLFRCQGAHPAPAHPGDRVGAEASPRTRGEAGDAGPTCLRGDRQRYRSDEGVSTSWSGRSRSVPLVRTVPGGGSSP